MLPNTTTVEGTRLPAEAAALLVHDYRFVTITGLEVGDGHDLYYHFDKDYELLNLLVHLPKGSPLPSISHVCFAAVLVENELKDLFGIDVQNLPIDYKGRLLLAEAAPATPFNKPATEGGTK